MESRIPIQTYVRQRKMTQDEMATIELFLFGLGVDSELRYFNRVKY